MDEGQVRFERHGTGFYGVHTDVWSGSMEYVGQVWSEPDYSAAAKRRSVPGQAWFFRTKGSCIEQGPFTTRGGAAEQLIRR